ncbi:MAG: hypothetical protein GY927_18860 [bacterium]|nr:hypothetical protein [bacterium]
MRIAIGILLATFIAGAASGKELPKGQFTQSQCVECHKQETPGLVIAWRAGPHKKNAGGADCVACHGAQHDDSMTKARRNNACISCHGGEKSAVAKSYFTSKHGVIARLEGANWNWSLPLADANYRTPTCAYCHMYEGEHGMTDKDDTSTSACTGCHAPGYVEKMLEAGKRSLDVGALKLREAEAAISSLKTSVKVSPRHDKILTAMAIKMRQRTLANLRLGLGHQSPDYQWWYGQAALDGDLIRIKARITRLHREKSSKNTSPP